MLGNYMLTQTLERQWKKKSTHQHMDTTFDQDQQKNQKYNMVSIGQQSTIAKPHLHIMLNQVGVREGLRKFGEEGNDALLKELNQLHERDALLPKKKKDMTYDERKKAWRYLMFLKEKEMDQSNPEDAPTEGANVNRLQRQKPARQLYRSRP